ncbi:MAG: polysaccharide biosynthesis C-terminal domain-containing protein [Lachnospiraceae bacterium]|nr:polysaccharide biosynthesis C-terminal domain-containing protein [Lachnospiraceae bacterium]
MSKIRYLANNIALFSVSNFVSKVLVFLLVPLYTNVLSTREYGIADVFQVTLLLLVPALTVNMGEGALRFGIEYREKRGSILSSGLRITFLAAGAVAFFCLLGMVFVPSEIRWYLFLFIFLFFTNAMYEFLILYFQGSELVPVVVVGSIFSTLTMILCNLLFLLVFKIGLNGYLFSQMIAFGAAALLMLLLGLSKQRQADDFEIRRDKDTERTMLSYGKPLILYSTGSWINNAADRYLVLFLCGASVNGLYGVAYKIPAILMVFQRIFAQAWQMSATKSYQDEKSAEFFSLMYTCYHTFMVIGCALLILILRPLAALMFLKDFHEAWMFVPPLLISVIFGALTGFLGSICLAHKDSKSMGIATGCGAALNVILNLLLIPKMGAMGAAIATAVSYFTMYFAALLITRKYVKIRARFVRDYAAYALLAAEAVLLITLREGLLCYLLLALIVTILFFLHIEEVQTIFKKFLSVLPIGRKPENNT